MDREIVATLAGMVFGYLLGSVLPALLVARLRGVDIRAMGTGNPGATNVAETLGYGVGAFVAAFDVLKAPLAVLAAEAAGAPMAGAYLAGAAAVVGHRAPFYLGFHGGTGISTLAGLGLFALAMLCREDPGFARVLAPLLAVMAVIFFVRLRQGMRHHKPTLLFVFGFLPALVLAALAYRGIDSHTVVLLAVSALTVVHRLSELLGPRLAELPAEERVRLGRKWIRPAAIFFPLGALWLREPTLWLLAAVFVGFAGLEVYRFVSQQHHFPRIYRPEERARISSVVIFLLGMLVTLALFPPEIASLAIFFLIFGDLMAFAVGTALGGPGFLDKTWSGTAACLVTCAILALVHASLGLVPAPVGLLGAAVATAGEALPIADDNFVVPVAGALAMSWALG